MAEKIAEINGVDVFEHDYETFRDGKNCVPVSALEAYGAAFKLNFFLGNSLGFYEDTYETWRNMSPIRDENRIDLMDNYNFVVYGISRLEIAFMYIVNATVWCALWDKKEQTWYGDFELPNI